MKKPDKDNEIKSLDRFKDIHVQDINWYILYPTTRKNKSIKSAETLLTKRCLNCGLDNSKAEKFLNVKMPNMKRIVKNIIKNYKKTTQLINN